MSNSIRCADRLRLYLTTFTTGRFTNDLSRIVRVARNTFDYSTSKLFKGAVGNVAFSSEIHVKSRMTRSAIGIARVAFLILFPRYVTAQPTYLESLGGAGADVARAIVSLPDGGVAIAGRSNSFGPNRVFVAKIFDDGSVDWAQTLSGEEANCMMMSTDGELILGGQISPYGPFLATLSINGTFVWGKTLGFPGSEEVDALSIAGDRGIVALGTTNSFGSIDFLLFKLHANQTLHWVKTLGGSRQDSPGALTTSNDGCLVITGLSSSFNDDQSDPGDFFVAKLGEDGVLIWVKIIDIENTEWPHAIVSLPDGGLVVGGEVQTEEADLSGIAKLWANGTLAWVGTFSELNGYYCGVNGLALASEGSFTSTGLYYSAENDVDGICIIRWSEDGMPLWTKALHTNQASAEGITSTTSEGVAIAGYAGNDMMLFTLTANGQMFNCSYLHDVEFPIFDATSTVNITTPSLTDNFHTDVPLSDWTGVTASYINPAVLQQCINTPPIYLEGSSTAVFTENASPVAINPNVNIRSAFSQMLTGARAVITVGLNPLEDRLSLQAITNISSSYNTSTGTLELIGNETDASYQTLLRSIAYENLSELPTTTQRVVAFYIQSEQVVVPLMNRVTVISINDNPIISLAANTTLEYVTDSSLMVIAPDLMLEDVDNTTLNRAIVWIEGGFQNSEDALGYSEQSGISFSLDFLNGILSLSGIAPMESYEIALRNVTYRNLASTPTFQERTISFVASDGIRNSSSVSRRVQILPQSSSSSKSAKSSPSSSVPNSDLGLALGLTFALITVAGGVAAVAGVYLWKREKNKRNDIEMSPIPDREEVGVIIKGRFQLLTKMKPRVAQEVSDKTGIEIALVTNEKGKVKVLIGQGQFGKMRIAYDKQTGMYVGVKKIKGDKSIEASQQESTIQTRLSNITGVMPLLDSVTTTGSRDEPVLYQFMPLAGFGNGEVLQNTLPYAELADRRKILGDVAFSILTALKGIHEKNVAHLDLKPSNIVIDKTGNVFLIDFGCAVEASNLNAINDKDGDTRYFSPSRLEYYRGRGNPDARFSGVKADLWAFAIMLLEMMHGRYPLPESTWEQKLTLWNTESMKLLLKPMLEHEDFPTLEGFIKELLNADAQSGVSTEDLLQHPLFKNSSYKFTNAEERQSTYNKLREKMKALKSTQVLPVNKTAGELYAARLQGPHTYVNEPNEPKQDTPHSYVNAEQ